MAQSQPVCFYNVLILAMHMELTQNYISLHHKAKPIKFQCLYLHLSYDDGGLIKMHGPCTRCMLQRFYTLQHKAYHLHTVATFMAQDIKVQCKEVKNTTSLLSVIMLLIEQHVSAY